MKLAPMLLLPLGELRFGEWREIDLDAASWTVPVARAKASELGRPFRSRQRWTVSLTTPRCCATCSAVTHGSAFMALLPIRCPKVVLSRLESNWGLVESVAASARGETYPRLERAMKPSDTSAVAGPNLVRVPGGQFEARLFARCIGGEQRSPESAGMEELAPNERTGRFLERSRPV